MVAVPADVLAKLSTSKDVAATLDSYNPPQPEFKALKAQLAILRKGPVAQPEEPAVHYAREAAPARSQDSQDTTADC